VPGALTDEAAAALQLATIDEDPTNELNRNFLRVDI
jgi:hypothetical protein